MVVFVVLVVLTVVLLFVELVEFEVEVEVELDVLLVETVVTVVAVVLVVVAPDSHWPLGVQIAWFTNVPPRSPQLPSSISPPSAHEPSN